MKFSEMNARVDELRAAREVVHNELHALLDNEDMTVGERKKQEAALRAKIREINKVCFPMEVIRGKTDRAIKGTLKPEEAALYSECMDAVGGVTLG